MLSAFRTIPLAFVAALLALGDRGAAQVIATNGAPQGPRTGVVVGQVIDGISGEPIPEATVTLSMPAFLATLPTTPRGRVIADADGRFFFTDLPAGEYYLGAIRDGYVTGQYGQRRATARGELLPLKEGERRIDVVLRVWKYAVIGGTVLDEAGEPVVGVAVRALVRDVVAGHVKFGTESYNVPSTLTDDRGVFRLSRVLPGTYAVVAPSMHTTVPLSVMNSWDANTLRLELWRAGVYEVSPLGQPRTQQAGDGLEQRALARAVGAEQRDDLAGAHAERDAAERAQVAVRCVQVAHLKHGAPPSRRRPGRRRARRDRRRPPPACPRRSSRPRSARSAGRTGPSAPRRCARP